MESVALARFAYSLIKDSSKKVSKFIRDDSRSMTDALAKHLVAADAWSNSINMLGMTRSADVRTQSIALSISAQPRRFHAARDPDAIVGEDIILQAGPDMAVLGDPGAGKTTAIKRAILHLMSFEEDEVGRCNYGFPILIFGRDISQDSGLFDKVFEAIGYGIISRDVDDSDRQEFDEWSRNRSSHIKEAVSSTLLNTSVILFVDGIDEVPLSLQSEFGRDIEYLSKRMSKGKTVLTCRSGDWTHALSGFDVYEIGALSDSNVAEISKMWAKRPDDFMEAIREIPYRDMLDRPLLLTLLIIIFNQTGTLPEQPVDAYQRFIGLLISEWDEQRDVARSSRFQNFQAGRKFKFLADAAYQLMIRYGLSRFTTSELISGLSSTALRFGQSQDEIKAIARELESHTGLLVASGFGNYEFCHLTVQEFLAANHLIGLPPRMRGLGKVADVSPATLAVAVSLSSTPTEFFADAIAELLGAHSRNFRNPINGKFLKSFLARLRLERPLFNPTLELGIATLLILYAYDLGHVMRHSIPEYKTMWDEVKALLRDPAIADSLEKVGSLCQVGRSPYETSYEGDGVVVTPQPNVALNGYVADSTFEFSLSRALINSLKELDVGSWLTEAQGD